jgi:hypothetical protein
MIKIRQKYSVVLEVCTLGAEEIISPETVARVIEETINRGPMSLAVRAVSYKLIERVIDGTEGKEKET